MIDERFAPAAFERVRDDPDRLTWLRRRLRRGRDAAMTPRVRHS